MNKLTSFGLIVNQTQSKQLACQWKSIPQCFPGSCKYFFNFKVSCGVEIKTRPLQITLRVYFTIKFNRRWKTITDRVYTDSIVLWTPNVTENKVELFRQQNYSPQRKLERQRQNESEALITALLLLITNLFTEYFNYIVISDKRWNCCQFKDSPVATCGVSSLQSREQI